MLLKIGEADLFGFDFVAWQVPEDSPRLSRQRPTWFFGPQLQDHKSTPSISAPAGEDRGPPAKSLPVSATEYFQESARALIARAVELARLAGAARVELEHLLLCASPEALEKAGLTEVMREMKSPMPVGSSATTTLEFSPKVLRLFQQAWLAAEARVEEVHLLLCLDLRGRGGPRLASLMTAEVEQRLQAAGVDVKCLMSEIGHLELLSARPDANFWQTPSGRRLMDLVCAATRPGTAAFAILLSHLLRHGSFRTALARAGLSEARLIEILLETEDSRLLVEMHLKSALIDIDGLDEAARVALAVAWNCSQQKPVTPQNLLDGLLYADLLVQPGQGATAVLRSHGVVGFVHSNIKRIAVPENAEPPKFSEEVEKVFSLALSLAGENLVSTQHLLYGLTMVGMDELRQVGITPSSIGKWLP